MDKNLITPCGIYCRECPAYGATRAGDPSKLAEVAAQWSTDEMKFGADNVVCDGCHGPRTYKWCMECPTRACSLEKGYRTCAECGDYPCDKLNEAWKMRGDEGVKVKANLDILRAR